MTLAELLNIKIENQSTYNLKQLAELAGINTSTLWRWRSGQKQPLNIVAFAKIADVLGITIAEIASLNID